MPLSDPRMPTLHGKYKVPHFDGKGEADEAFARLGVPTTFFYTSFYWENFLIHFPGMGLRKGDARRAGPGHADRATSGCRASPSRTSALCALGVFKQTCSAGQRIGMAGEHLTGAEMAAVD